MQVDLFSAIGVWLLVGWFVYSCIGGVVERFFIWDSCECTYIFMLLSIG